MLVRLLWIAVSGVLLSSCTEAPKIGRQKRSQTQLLSLDVSSGVLFPNFNPVKKNYSLKLSHSHRQISIVPKTRFQQIIYINDQVPQASYPLSVGRQVFLISVLSKDMRHTETYSLVVLRHPDIREPSSNPAIAAPREE